MKQFRDSVINKFLNGERPGRIFKALKSLGVKRDFVYKTIKRYKDTSSLNDRKRSGRPRSVRTKSVIKAVRERIRRKPGRSIRKLVADLDIKRGSIHNILKVDLGCKAYKKRKVHGISELSRRKRLDRVAHILAWHDGDEFIFSAEKLFVLQQSNNTQNDRVWAVSIDSIPENQKNVPRFQNAASIMVWGAVSKRGKLPLIFIDKGVKINAEYYKAEVLEKNVLPYLQIMYGDD